MDMTLTCMVLLLTAMVYADDGVVIQRDECTVLLEALKSEGACSPFYDCLKDSDCPGESYCSWELKCEPKDQCCVNGNSISGCEEDCNSCSCSGGMKSITVLSDYDLDQPGGGVKMELENDANNRKIFTFYKDSGLPNPLKIYSTAWMESGEKVAVLLDTSCTTTNGVGWKSPLGIEVLAYSDSEETKCPSDTIYGPSSYVHVGEGFFPMDAASTSTCSVDLDCGEKFGLCETDGSCTECSCSGGMSAVTFEYLGTDPNAQLTTDVGQLTRIRGNIWVVSSGSPALKVKNPVITDPDGNTADLHTSCSVHLIGEIFGGIVKPRSFLSVEDITGCCHLAESNCAECISNAECGEGYYCNVHSRCEEKEYCCVLDEEGIAPSSGQCEEECSENPSTDLCESDCWPILKNVNAEIAQCLKEPVYAALASSTALDCLEKADTGDDRFCGPHYTKLMAHYVALDGQIECSDVTNTGCCLASLEDYSLTLADSMDDEDQRALHEWLKATRESCGISTSACSEYSTIKSTYSTILQSSASSVSPVVAWFVVTLALVFGN